MLQLAKLQTYLLHFHREVNITNIPIFLPDVIPVYESHVLSEEKNILNRCLFHSISFKGKEKFSIQSMSPLRKNEPSLYKVYYKFNHLNRMNTYANILYCHSLSNKLILEFFRTRFQIFKITLQLPQTGYVFAF